MLKSKKHVFWEALIMTIVVFLIGFFIGMLLETNNSNKMADLYLKSEINLVDAMAVSQLSEKYGTDCNVIKKENIAFADRVYEEAKLLDDYDDMKTFTESTKYLHKKYDLLRTLIWMSNQNSLSRCENYNLLVYLYAYESEDTDIKATQNVYSKILGDLKKERADILLLPIAADQNLTSLNILMHNHNITSLPAVVINNKRVVYTLEEMSSLSQLLNNLYIKL